MVVLIAVLLGLVQGLTEFLPVSSSGHLYVLSTLTQGAVAEDQFNSFFTVMLHVATLVAVILVYRKQLWAILRHPLQKITLYLLIGTLPTIVFALLLKLFPALEDWLDAGNLVGASFLVTAGLLLLSDFFVRRHQKRRPLSAVRGRDALGVGLFQAVGVLPGVSRSGSTICGALACGMDRNAAADFSFLLSVPAILGATVLEAFKLIKDPSAFAAATDGGFLAALLVGMVVAGVTGYFAVRFMIRLIKHKGLWGFAIYTAALGVLVLIFQFCGVLGFGFTQLGGVS